MPIQSERCGEIVGSDGRGEVVVRSHLRVLVDSLSALHSVRWIGISLLL
jgi:hypothetical protein